MNPIAAPLQKPAPQPDREVGSSQAEADAPNPPRAGARRGFADALRAASGQPPRDQADADGSEAAESEGGAKTADPTQAIPIAPLPSADSAGAAAAILANILVAATTAAPVALPAGGATLPTGGAGDRTDSAGPGADGGVALRIASAPGSTAGLGSIPQAGTIFGLSNAAATPRRDGTDPTTGPAPTIPSTAGPAPAALPKVTVLDRAVHFKPVLPNAAPAEPALPAAPASVSTPVSAPGPAEGTGVKLQRAQIESPALATAAAPKVPVQGSPQPVSDPAGAAVRAAGAGLEKADVAALSDSRAVSGIAWAGLASDKRSGEAEAAGPQAPGATATGLPAGTLPTIAAAIRDELNRAAVSEPAARAAQADPAVQTAPDGPMRVLRIQLRPDDLGTVTVELRLANGQLETHLRASQPETAALLHRDAAILTDLLKQANYQAEVTVSQARPSDSGGFSGNAPSQGQSGFSDGGARPGQGGDRQRQADRSPAAGRWEGERGDEAIRPRDGGVYL